MDTNDWSDAEQRVERAQELFEQRKWQEALDELLLATTINPYNGGWFFNIGLILDEMGRLDQAIDAYRRSLEIEPDDIQALHHLGTDLQHLERFSEAIGVFARIESIDPAFEPCYCGRIQCYGELGEHEKAEEMFYLARLYKEHCPACYFNMGCSLAARDLYDKAIFCWMRMLDGASHALHEDGGAGYLIDPLNSSGSTLGDPHGASHGVAHGGVAHGGGGARGGPPGDSRSGHAAHFLATELAEMQAEVHVRIAQALWNKGELERARQHYVLGLRQDPGNTGTLLDLSDLLLEMKRWDEAGEKIRRAIELAPDDPASHFCFGRWLLRRSLDDQAIASLKRALELDPTWPGAHLLMGEAFLRQNREADACQHLRAELLLRPQEPQRLMDLANLLLDVNESRAAVACLKRLTQLCPDHASAWQNLAVAQFVRGRYEEGIASSREALRLEPRNRSALHNLAMALGRLKRFDEAIELTRRGMALVPIDPTIERLDFRLRIGRLNHRLMTAMRCGVSGAVSIVVSIVPRFGR